MSAVTSTGPFGPPGRGGSRLQGVGIGELAPWVPVSSAVFVFGVVSLTLLLGIGLAVRPDGIQRPGETGSDEQPTDGHPLRQHRRTSRWFGYGLCWTALVVALWSATSGWAPPSVPVVVVALFVASGTLARTGRVSATAALGYGVWPALAALVAAVGFSPLSSLPLPDIGVFGRYTYLATEVAFGSVALALLLRAGRDAARSAAVTIAVLYPVAYVWDWYTLTTGVFAIQLRTGVEFASIPVEEHLFMVVVPAFVLALHETVTPLLTE